MRKAFRISAVAVFFVLGICAAARADFGFDVPEIDAGMAPAALSVLTGGILILANKFRRK